MSRSNAFERIGRLNKTAKLVRALDRQLEDAGLDPMMPGLGDAPKWALLAVANGIKPPSPITVGAVIDAYRERNEVRRSA